MSFTQMEHNDRNKYTQSLNRRFQSAVRYGNYNWKMLCGLDKSAQKSVVLQRKSTYLLCVSIFSFLTSKQRNQNNQMIVTFYRATKINYKMLVQLTSKH